ncbi:Crp/Fnr family transcriptional regulator [Bdellovibrio sp. HCB288]|uniref:Crp/Fnr family transcriptional regulator n=1 Tax=Bdellovibrio sp. HCB288 TaxID=3394355 RepID=UPI0039B6D6F0
MVQSQIKKCENCFLLDKKLKIKDTTVISLLKDKSVQHIQSKGCILSQGCLPMNIYCVAEGKINTIERDIEGREHLVSTFTPSNLFPLTNVITDHPTNFEYVSEGKTRLCSFPVKTVRDLLSVDPQLSILFLKNACSKGLNSYERIVTLQSKSASDKVLRTVEQFMNEDGYCHLTRKEISLWANLTIETVIRTLTALEKKKQVKKSSKGIQILPQ